MFTLKSRFLASLETEKTCYYTETIISDPVVPDTLYFEHRHFFRLPLCERSQLSLTNLTCLAHAIT